MKKRGLNASDNAWNCCLPAIRRCSPAWSEFFRRLPAIRHSTDSLARSLPIKLFLLHYGQSVTKMDSHNLAIVFAPTILRPPEDSASQSQESTIAALLGDSLHAHKLMDLFIKHYDELLSVHLLRVTSRPPTE